MKFRNFAHASLMGLVMTLQARGEAIPLSPIKVPKGEFQYFVDDYLVENRFDQRFLVSVRHYVHKGISEKQNPVLRADKPWETAGVIGPTSVIYDQKSQLFRAYYHIYSSPDRSVPARVGYAESKDGIQWTKPELDAYLWNGEKTNIVFENGKKDASVFQIVDVPESARNGYSLLGYYTGADGGYLAGSNDGTGWKTLQRIIPDRSDCQHNVVYDKQREEFVIYFRNLRQFKQVADHPRSGTTRVISRVSSKTLFTLWEEVPKAILLPEDEDAPLFYGMPVTIRDNVYFGFLEQYELYPKETLDVELRTSRDGFVWKRHRSDELLIKRGTYGQWDGGMVKPAGLVERGNEWLLFYTGYGGYHREALAKGAAMGLLRFRKEGFVSIRSNPTNRAFVITRPLVWPGGDLLVNFDGKDVFPQAGWLKVQVVDAERKVLEGFSFDESEPFEGDETRAKMKWKSASLSNLAGQEIRFEFQFQHGDLFGFVAE